ncbi:TIM barrel protein [Candidatus Poribacteria bacterium]|nr:TIM barrel protein [Candidatus Poribacteria bacterium]
MELAICRGDLDKTQETIDWLKDNEARIVETSPYFFLENEDDLVTETVSMFKKSDIWIRSIHAPFGSNCNLSDFDVDKRETAIQTHRNLIHKAGIAGVEMIVIHPGVGGLETEEDMDKANQIAYESICRLMDSASLSNVQLALENMLASHPGYKVSHIQKTIEKIDSPLLGVCFDTGHAHLCDNIEEFMETLGEKFINIHIQDNDKIRDTHIQPPYGTTDWPDFVRLLHKINYDMPLTIETAPWGNASYKQMLKEVGALLDNPEDINFRCRKCKHLVMKGKDHWFCNCANE